MGTQRDLDVDDETDTHALGIASVLREYFMEHQLVGQVSWDGCELLVSFRPADVEDHT